MHGDTPDKQELRRNYVETFLPLARQGRLLGIDAYFGTPALYDLNRAMRIATPLYP